MKKDIHESLSKATKTLCQSEPFYGLFLMMLNKSFSKSVPTAGVGKNGINYQLVVNDVFWESLSDLHKLMILKHELLHVCFFHVETWADYENHEVANIAADICVNQYIDSKWLPEFNVSSKDYRKKYENLVKALIKKLASAEITREQAVEELRVMPPRGVYFHDFAELNMDPSMGLKYYYDKLMQAKDKCPGQPGYCEALDEMMKQMSAGVPQVCDHDWKEFENMSEAEKKLLRSQTDYHLKEIANQVSKNRGTVPGEMKGYIEGIDKEEPPKFDWKSYVRRFMGGSNKVYTKKLHRKYNKRFEENPGLKIKPRRRVLIGVDTSGSMSKLELIEGFHEVYHVQKTGTEIVVVQFDAAIRHVNPYRRGLEDTIEIFGRGGTDFNPIVNYANEHARDFSAMIIFTDGEAPAPEEKCRLRTLWVHSSNSAINEDLQGFKIQLPK